MKDFTQYIKIRGYKPIFNTRGETTAWYKSGPKCTTSHTLVNSVIYSQAHRKGKPSYDPARAYLVAAEVAHNNGQMETAWVHEEASNVRLYDEIVYNEMVACNNAYEQKQVAADYLGEDLLTKYVTHNDYGASGINRWALKNAFCAAAQRARFNRAPENYPAEAHGLLLLRGMFELDGVTSDYSRFKFKDAPVYIEVIRDPKGLGNRADRSGYLVTTDIANILIPADFSKVGFGCQVDDEFAKAVRMAATVGLTSYSDPSDAFRLLSNCFELSVFDDGGDIGLYDPSKERSPEEWRNLIDEGYRSETGEDLVVSYEDSGPSAPAP